MAQTEETFLNEGIQIIWVLVQDRSFRSGTAVRCRSTFNQFGSDKGLCVGDDESRPINIFDDSPFARGRGIDLVVRRRDMKVLFATGHGTPSGNTNLTGTQLLNEIRQLPI